MSSPMIFLLGLLVSLLNAAGHSTRSAITDQEFHTLKMVQGRVSRRLDDLEPKLEILEAITRAASRDDAGQPIYTDEQIADIRNIRAVMMQQLENADEIRMRLNEHEPEDGYVPPTQPNNNGSDGAEVRDFRDRVGLTRAGCCGIGKAKIGSQDPGVVAGNMRRTGIIVNIQALGKRNHNGVAEPVGDIKLDHPVGTGPMQEGADSKYLNVWFSSYRRGAKPMRKGDWVEFEVVQGRSSQGYKAGRVMAGDVRKIGYMSNEERHTDYWKPFFQGTLVNEGGESVIGQETGTPYYKHPSNPKSCYSRSQYSRSQAGGRRATSSERGGRARSNERAFASGSESDAAQDSGDAAEPVAPAPGLERQPQWRHEAQMHQMRQPQRQQNGWNAQGQDAPPANAHLPPVGGSLTLLPRYANDHREDARLQNLVFQQPGEVIQVDQQAGMAHVRFAPRDVANAATGWVNANMIETAYADYNVVQYAKGYGKGKPQAGRANAGAWRQ